MCTRALNRGLVAALAALALWMTTTSALAPSVTARPVTDNAVTAHQKAAVPGAEVGFWAGDTTQPCPQPDPSYCPRGLSAYTPEVWNTLASSHGALYLNLVYGSDFGPVPPGRTQRTDALPLIRQASRLGIPVNAWITLPRADGTYANKTNAAAVRAAVEAFQAWSTQLRLPVRQTVVLDLEFPLGTQAVVQALHGDLSAVEELAHANIDPAGQCVALTAYRDTISWAHQHGMPLAGTPIAFALDDLANGSIALQDALDIAAFPPFGYDDLYLQAYRSFGGADLGGGYVASYYRDMQSYFGATGQASLGDTRFPPYSTDLNTLVTDVRMLAGLGATAIPVYDLDATVSAFGAPGVSAVVNAGRQPLTGAALTAATQPTLPGTAARALYAQLDTIVTDLTPIVRPGQHPNAYPNGCGDLHAVPLTP